MKYNFQEQLKLGKLGEKKVFDYLNSLPKTINVHNLSENKKFQGYGVDGLWVFDNEATNELNSIFFDIKTEFQYHKTGKIFLEVSSGGNDGGFLSTKANNFFYYDPFGGYLIKLPVYGLKRWYERSGISIDHKTVKGDNGYECYGLFVAPEVLEGDGVNVEVEKIGELPTLYTQ
jgi:hypothetical protein